MVILTHLHTRIHTPKDIIRIFREKYTSPILQLSCSPAGGTQSSRTLRRELAGRSSARQAGGSAATTAARLRPEWTRDLRAQLGSSSLPFRKFNGVYRQGSQNLLKCVRHLAGKMFRMHFVCSPGKLRSRHVAASSMTSLRSGSSPISAVMLPSVQRVPSPVILVSNNELRNRALEFTCTLKSGMLAEEGETVSIQLFLGFTAHFTGWSMRFRWQR